MGFFKRLTQNVGKLFGGSAPKGRAARPAAIPRARVGNATFPPVGEATFEVLPLPRPKTEAEEEADVMRVLRGDLPETTTQEQDETAAEKAVREAGANDREEAYLLGEVIEVTSSNVSWIQYLWRYPGPNGEPLAGPDQNEMFIGYHDGSVYQYEQIDFDLALSMFRANSHGKWVWQNLRVLGTVFGFQKPYRLVSGHRVWNQTPDAIARHESIPKSGEPYKGYHPAMNYADAKGPMGASGINLGKKGSKKKAYFTPIKAKTTHTPKAKP